MRLKKSFIFIILSLAVFSTIVFANNEKKDAHFSNFTLKQEIENLKIKVAQLEKRVHVLENQKPRVMPLNNS